MRKASEADDDCWICFSVATVVGSVSSMHPVRDDSETAATHNPKIDLYIFIVLIRILI